VEDMIARFTHWQGRKPESIAADASYGNGEFLQWLMDWEITPYNAHVGCRRTNEKPLLLWCCVSASIQRCVAFHRVCHSDHTFT